MATMIIKYSVLVFALLVCFLFHDTLTSFNLRNIFDSSHRESTRKKGGFNSDDAEVLERSAGNFKNCSDYRSILQITWTDGGSGLGDRSGRIESYGDLATWLCATLILPPPSMWLKRKHNGRISLSEEIKWSDYLKTVRLIDG